MTKIATIKRWEVWYARVQFEDSVEIKERPIVILEDNLSCVLFLNVTSQCPRNHYTEYQLRYWREANLWKPSVVRISKMFNISYDCLIRKLGDLDIFDSIAISRILQTYSNDPNKF